MTQDSTHFGFQDVPVAEKAARVKGVFSAVASRYDIMNDVMSGGMHHLWKNRLISELNPQPGSNLLDVAGGTGDIAFRFLKTAPSAEVTVCDINADMLAQGKKRAIDRNQLKGMEWLCGNAESLPLPSNTYDYYTIAFGIRNVTHIDRALAEAYRVLKPGGRFLCLEFSHVAPALLAKAYDWYSFQIIPRMGDWIAGERDAYQYLVESIRKFPDQERFATMIREAGFAQVRYTNLTQGVVAIHSGWKV